MANDFNDLGPILGAIKRQIAEGKDVPARASRPERDLPILLLPKDATRQTGSDRKRDERDLPFLMNQAPPPEPAAPADPPEPSRPQRNEAAYLRIDPDLGGTPA